MKNAGFGECETYPLQVKLPYITPAILKIVVHLALVKVIPNSIILELDKIQKHFIRKNSNPKIKQDTLCKDYESGGLKNVDIMFNIIVLQFC